ncbi:MAG: molybdopterin dinucleotide binding domain-containing protein, partial [Promethearchaeota archaeon]
PHFNIPKMVLDKDSGLHKNEFLLISPAHPQFLHSQLGQLHSEYIEDFGKIFLSPEDINNKKLGLEIGSQVSVSNKFGTAVYTLEKSDQLKPGVALIYSGLSSPKKSRSNVNLFTPGKPEWLGNSGSYNSTSVKIVPL